MLRTLQTGLLACLLAIALFSAIAHAQQPPGPSGPVPSSPASSNPAPPTIDFRDIATDAGLTAENVSGGADKKRYILETTGDGVAIFDFDNDGLMDILLVNATTMDGKGRGEKSTSHLYRNLGNFHF